tara:strand:+ start:357 stop:1085 length:729 start_codon:yes stop_codon:yes gene_type:complete
VSSVSNKVSTVAEALSERAKVALSGHSKNRFQAKGSVQIPQGLVDSLRHHLENGETHYPDRPGMLQLRKRIGKEVGKYLDGTRDESEVLITASEGEAVFVTILGLDLVPGGCILGSEGLLHQELFDWMGIEIRRLEDRSTSIAYWELNTKMGVKSCKGDLDTEIYAFGDILFGEEIEGLKLKPDTIVVGSLSSVLGIHGFDLGFVSAEASVLKAITAWKQASSICAPSPSQRVALWALGERP